MPARNIKYIAVVLMALCRVSWAATPQEVHLTGQGADKRAAILDGLLQAIEQINGVSIDHKTTTYRSYSNELQDFKQRFQSAVIGNEEIKTASRGLIDSYTTGDPQETKGRCEISMSVNVC